MTVLADFTVETEYREGVPRRVLVVVYDSVKGLRIAASRYSSDLKGDALCGACHSFELRNNDGDVHPNCAIVRLAEPHLGVGVISHEFAHAAVWIHELDGEPGPLAPGNDEQFAWVLGDLVRQAINAMYEHGVYDRAP